MRRLYKVLLPLALAFPGAGRAPAQTSFPLEREDGACYIRARVNSADSVRVLLTSAAAVMIMGRQDCERLLGAGDYRELPAVGGRPQDGEDGGEVRRVLEGRVTVGDLSYEGPVFVTGGDDGVTVPVHLLKNDKDSAANIILIDPVRMRLDFVREEASEVKGMKAFPAVSFSPVPVIETNLFLADSEGRSGWMEGRFVFDVSNRLPLCLFPGDAETADFLERTGFTFTTVREQSSGRQIVRATAISRARLGKYKAQHVVAGLSDFPGYPGISASVGPSFFRGRILMDTGKGIIYCE